MHVNPDTASRITSIQHWNFSLEKVRAGFFSCSIGVTTSAVVAHLGTELRIKFVINAGVSRNDS